jgi:hypothetical protein
VVLGWAKILLDIGSLGENNTDLDSGQYHGWQSMVMARQYAASSEIHEKTALRAL